MDRTLLVAQHFFALAVSNGNAPDWVQLTPVSSGAFSTRDGRGPFTIKNVASVIAASLQNGAIGMDYDHATDLAAKEGVSAPAAGWIVELCDHGPGNETGIWGRVEWTPRGGKSVTDKEYRGISPVLLTNKAGELVAIGRAALTNDPALVLKNLFSTQQLATPQEFATPMNRDQLCDMLGVPRNSSDDQVHTAAKGATGDTKKKLFSSLGLPETATDDDVMGAVRKVGVQSSTLANVKRVLEAAGLSGDVLDDTTTIALCTKLKTQPAAGSTAKEVTLQAQVDELQKQYASLAARNAGQDAETAVTAAITAGKLAPGQKTWAIDYCTRDPKGFKDFIGTAPVIVGNGSMLPDAPAEDGLTPQEKKICATLNIKPDDFKATRATMKVGTL